MLKAENLSFSYGRKKVFEHLDFSADKGQCLVLFGANGAGKSTLLSVLAGLKKPKGGKLTLPEGRVGYVPQHGGIFEDMSIGDNLRFFAGLQDATDALKGPLPFGFDPSDKRKVSTLSGGNKKKLSILCSLIARPSLLLLDEPCAGLDLRYRAELTEILREEKIRGTIIVYAGHEPGEFETFFDGLLVLGRDKPLLFAREDIYRGEGSPEKELPSFLLRCLIDSDLTNHSPKGE